MKKICKICNTCWHFKEFLTQERKDWYGREGECLKQKRVKYIHDKCSAWKSEEEELIKRKAW